MFEAILPLHWVRLEYDKYRTKKSVTQKLHTTVAILSHPYINNY